MSALTRPIVAPSSKIFTLDSGYAVPSMMTSVGLGGV